MIRNLWMRFPEGKGKVVTLSYDDGTVHDVRLMETMDAYGIKGTFNLNANLFKQKETDNPGSQRMTYESAISLYKNCPHEIAMHGFDHPFFDQLPTPSMGYQIIEDRKELEGLFGRIIRGCAYPYGTYNETVEQQLALAGIVYARTIKCREDFMINEDWLALEATAHHNNPKLPELMEEFLNLDVKRHVRMFYLWGHSYEFDSNNNWEVIENFCKTMGGKEDIWYATNIEIFDYITAFRQLRFSVTMDRVENPTATTIWFQLGDQTYKVAPGETIALEA